uniref:Uncharacterized protein n=1 Tax=Rhizophora mucronata TaxID=61149 RepID=A0A2P2QQ45_RHIMU
MTIGLCLRKEPNQLTAGSIDTQPYNKRLLRWLRTCWMSNLFKATSIHLCLRWF